MATLKRDRLLNTTLSAAWQLIGDVGNWPAIFSDMAKVQVRERTSETTQVVVTDERARSFQMTLRSPAPEDQAERSITASFDGPDAHPQGFQSIQWVLTPQNHQTHLSLTAQYTTPIPILGELIGRLRGRANAEFHLQAAFDTVVHKAHEQVWNYQETVQTVLTRKGAHIISALPTDTVASICTLIETHRIGAVLILDSNDALVGLVSERDVVYQLAAKGPEILDLPAAQVMTRDLIVCEPSSDLLFVMACMTDNKIRHLPVLDAGKLCGVISIGDVVQQRIHSLEAESGTLKDYIAAREWRFHSHHAVPGADTPAVAQVDSPSVEN